LPKIEVSCAREGNTQRRARCKSWGTFGTLDAVLSEFGGSLLASKSSAMGGTREVGTFAEARKPASGCAHAAEGLRRACKSTISGQIFFCIAKQIFAGDRYNLCKPTACGKSLAKLATKCPQAVRQGVLNADVVTRITGVKIDGVKQADQEERRRCQDGMCSVIRD
jgi:hypothetical protein